MDDDAAVRDSLRALLESAGYAVKDFDTAKALLESPTIGNGYCVVADIRMPDMDGLTLQQELIKRQIALPVIIVTGHGDVPLAVRAMKAGAVDFIEKPFDEQVILDSVQKGARPGARNARSGDPHQGCRKPHRRSHRARTPGVRTSRRRTFQ